MEYIENFRLLFDNVLMSDKNRFYYNWRFKGPFFDEVYHHSKSTVVAKLPPRYLYSNTKEQLKSLYF